ncbi:MAG: imidazolonepropionase [Clostridia bacterium]|nr:imidazolonepropionase [Clostridia bacterium]
MAADIVVKNIGYLATAQGTQAVGGEKQNELLTLHNAFIAILDGDIIEVGEGEAREELLDEYTAEIDAEGRLVTAGLVDCHTHLTFGGWRENELKKKLLGVSYMDILKEGGGILSTVTETRRMDEQELYLRAEGFLNEMVAHGTTSLEAKSGYGLDLETELKQLRVNRMLAEQTEIDIASTYLGAHAVPLSFLSDKAGYIRYIIDVVLPQVAEQGLADFCDVFCEQGVFDAEDARRILSEAKRLGMGAKIHSDEIFDIGGTAVAEELLAVSADHLTATTEEGIMRLKHSGTIATLLPCTSFYLDKAYAKARDFIKNGVPVAIGSDFNPGSSPNLNLQLAMNLGCLRLKMTPYEVLTAVTLNAAAAIGMADRIGTIERGKQADLVLWDVQNPNELMYRYGTNRVDTVIKKGKVIV